MDTIKKTIENQVQFWSLLGPFLMLTSIAVLLFKMSAHWYIPVSALIGIPLCVKWKMRGMAIALGCLGLLSIIAYQQLALDERYWHVGMGLALAFSFVVLTLSLEEVEGLVGRLQAESQSRLDNFLILDDKLRKSEQEWTIERTQVKTETSILAQEITKLQEEKNTFYRLTQLAKEELIRIKTLYDQLVQEIFYKTQQTAQLQESLESSSLTIQQLIDENAKQQLLCGHIDQLHNKDLQSQHNIKNSQIAISQQSQKLTQTYVHTNTRDLASIYLQLKEQFAEKSSILDATRIELFAQKEACLRWSKNYTEEKIFDFSSYEQALQSHILAMGQEYEFMEKNYQQEIDMLTELVDALLKQIPTSKCRQSDLTGGSRS